MPSTAGAQAVAASAPLEVVSPMEMANQIGAADAMALKSVAPAAATAPSSSAPSSTDIVWRLAALVVRDAERYAVLTTSGQPALRLRVGEDLPDGDKIKAIHADRIDIKSPRGRVRTLYLIEP